MSGMLQTCAASYWRRHLWEAIGLNPRSPSLTAEGAWEARLAPASPTDGWDADDRPRMAVCLTFRVDAHLVG